MIRTSFIVYTVLSLFNSEIYAKEGNPWERTDDGIERLEKLKRYSIGPAYYGITEKSPYSYINDSCTRDKVITFDLKVYTKLDKFDVDNLYITSTTYESKVFLEELINAHKSKNKLNKPVLKPLEWQCWGGSKNGDVCIDEEIKKVSVCVGMSVVANFAKKFGAYALVSEAACGLRLTYNENIVNENENSDNNGTCEDADNNGGGATTPNPGGGSGSGGLADGNIKKVEVNGRHSVTLHPGEKFSLEVGINNKGEAVYEDAQVYVYLTDDKGADLRGDEPLKKDKNEVSDLDSDERKTVHLSGLKSPLKPGTYYVYAWIKSQKDTADSNYDNDYSRVDDKEEYAKITVVPRPKPNLTIANVKFVKKMYPYQHPKIQFDVKNTASNSTAVGNYKVLVQIFQGNVLKYGNVFNYSEDLVGANNSVTKYLTLGSGNLTKGIYTLKITADSGKMVSESNENDNVINHTFKVFPVPKADLLVEAISFSRANENSPFYLYYRLKNRGNKAVTKQICTLVRLYNSSGQEKFWKKDCSDADIPAGETLNREVRIYGLPAGSGYNAKLYTNYQGGRTVESDYGNNETNKGFSVFSLPKADLLVEAISFSRANENSPFYLYYRLKNRGKKAVTKQICTLVRLYNSSGQEKFWKKDCSDADIPVNGTLSRKVSVYGLPAGSGYNAKLYTNYQGGRTVESDYGNNETNKGFSVFIHRPDLIVIWPHASHRYTKNKSTNYFEFHIRNVGNKIYTGSSFVTVKVAGNGDYRVLWPKLNTTLRPGQQKYFKINLGRLHRGGHTVTVKADNNGVVSELNEYNNVSVTNVGVFN